MVAAMAAGESDRHRMTGGSLFVWKEVVVIADVNFHVWFDVDTNQNSSYVVPYVRSERDARLRYDLKILNSGKAGTSSISQGGTISVSAGQPKAISSVRVTPQTGSNCEVDLTLREDDEQVGQYTFDCGVKK
ncbi:hypothetical protein FAZ95_26370 [Trinickia violacea]|uniref:Curli assembly protein CsgC n=1 Tax=Trinickia violacea TaxID=2571746 RepID=A0A4P8IW61_9BURK|nr:curli-like amyloid fiber formation chaperone CsgH [Trinickia violacea]QCP52676.1 hypothetical protein FAZ95_26370 [Trinickia violacea]